MRTDEQTLTEFFNEIEELLQNDDVLRMADFISHGKTDCLSHCLAVAYEAFVKCRKRKLDARAAARGGLLHDFYLYDHTDKLEMQKRGGRHVRAHARVALINADEHFTLTNKERDIILKHMWPANLARPLFRESIIVNFADTRRAVLEFMRLDKLSGVMLASALDYVKHADARKARAKAKAEAEAAAAEAARVRKQQDDEEAQPISEHFQDFTQTQTATVEDGAEGTESLAVDGAADELTNLDVSPVQTSITIEESAAADKEENEHIEVVGAETVDNLNKIWRDESDTQPKTNESTNADADESIATQTTDLAQSGIITAESANSQPQNEKVLGDIYISPLPPKESEQPDEGERIVTNEHAPSLGERGAFERRTRADKTVANTRSERKPFERTQSTTRKPFERPERKPFERAATKPELERKPFERPERKPFDRAATKPELERKPFERPERKPFERAATKPELERKPLEHTTTKPEAERKPFERPERKD